MSDKEKFNQIDYQNSYNRENYDRICVMMPKGTKQIIKDAAAAAGQSMSEYIKQATMDRINDGN